MPECQEPRAGEPYRMLPRERLKDPARILSCIAALLTAVLLAAACSSSSSASSSNGQVKGTVVVFAAASLNGAFDTLGNQFKQQHPDVTMKFNYNGSSSLATSIKQGAQADLFACRSRQTRT